MNDPYAKLCVTDAVQNMNAKAFNLFNLILRTNETRYIKQLVSANIDYMQVFIIINNNGMKIIGDVTLLLEEYM